MGILLPGDLLPGAVGVLEQQTDTIQIGEGNTEGTISFTLEGDFDAAPTVATGGGISATSGGSSSTEVERLEVDHDGTVTADQVDVVVELDTAPGAGETTDVTVGAIFAEGGD